MSTKDISKILKDLIDKSSYSRTEIADKVNISKQTLYKYENGIVTNIPSDKIESFAKLFNVTPAYLMGWEENDVAEAVCEMQKDADAFYDVIEKNMSLYLPEEETELIKQFRSSDEQTKEMVRRILSFSNKE